jgi:signal transduction histidine kinase
VSASSAISTHQTWGRLEGWWATLSLAHQFALASSALVLAGLGILGFWVTQKIEDGIEQDVAVRAALYLESFVSPHLQELSSQSKLSEAMEQALDQVLARDAISLRIVEAKIWDRDGTILYGTNKDIVGQKFPVTGQLNRAWSGDISIDFDKEPHLNQINPKVIITDPVLEIYVPISSRKTSKIIAIAEFYQEASALRRELALAKLESWAITALVSLSIIAGLYSIVANGSKTIVSQRASLANRVDQLSDLLKQNEELRQNAQNASRRSAEDTEFHLRRLGSDLHDGIAQLLALALLRLDQLFQGKKDKSKDLELVRGLLNDAMTETRDISSGMALPEIEKLSVNAAIMLIAKGHKRRTSTKVTLDLPKEEISLSHPLKLCLCRFVQECLNNSFKHAGGVGQHVKATWNDASITVEVSDKGPGFSAKPSNGKRQPLGLVGLKNRLESFGGQLVITSNPLNGSRLTAIFPVSI